MHILSSNPNLCKTTHMVVKKNKCDFATKLLIQIQSIGIFRITFHNLVVQYVNDNVKIRLFIINREKIRSKTARSMSKYLNL